MISDMSGDSRVQWTQKGSWVVWFRHETTDDRRCSGDHTRVHLRCNLRILHMEQTQGKQTQAKETQILQIQVKN